MTHETFREMLPLYVVGALDGDDSTISSSTLPRTANDAPRNWPSIRLSPIR